MLGIDNFIRTHAHLKSTPIGILTNHATFSDSGYPVAYELQRQGFKIIKLFSPEHGIQSQGEDGIAQRDQIDQLTQLPVISLYGKALQPETNELADIEIVLVDLPNIGCRFYTYFWTLTYMLEACSLAKKKFVLLDRPNASVRSSAAMEGPLLNEEKCSSFLGRWKMPLTFSFSYGQLILWFVHDRSISVELEIIPYSTEPLRNFIPPSPSINEQQTVWAYPMTALFEGVNINHGRGTSFPFRVIGAPWINSLKFHEAFNNQGFSGIKAVPYSFKPMWSHYANKFCHGLYFTVNTFESFRPVETSLWMMSYLSAEYNDQLRPQPYPTLINPTGVNHLDLLFGLEHSYEYLCSGNNATKTQPTDLLDVQNWVRGVEQYLKGLAN